MPTTKKRTQVTHTPQIEEALRVAAQVWPNENAAALLTHLATEGAKTLEATRQRASAERKRQVDAIARDFAGIYPPGYLDDLRDEWPE